MFENKYYKNNLVINKENVRNTMMERRGKKLHRNIKSLSNLLE